MEIKFGTAEELQKQREEAFLKLSGHERVVKYLMMIEENRFLFGDKCAQKNSFVIRRKGDS